MKNGKPMTAVRLRLILSISMFLVAGSGAGLFYVADTTLSGVAQEVSKITAEANASSNNLQNLQTLERGLEKEQSAVKRAGELAANSQNYQYQNQIINDLNFYAAREGITLTNISFASSAGAETKAPITAPSGLTTATITVTVKNPIPYLNFLTFLKDIEQNLTKMQVSKISLSKGEDGVSSDVLAITLYVK